MGPDPDPELVRASMIALGTMGGGRGRFGGGEGEFLNAGGWNERRIWPGMRWDWWRQCTLYLSMSTSGQTQQPKGMVPLL